VTLEHGAAVAAALQHGRLAVLPGMHLLPMENPGLVNAVLLWFLAGADLRVPRPTFHLVSDRWRRDVLSPSV
jgi:hypothetical protein